MKNKGIIKAKTFLVENAIFAVFLMLFILSLLFIDGFASAHNLKNLIKNSTPLLVVACGLTFVVLNGGIDFSVTSIISLSSVVGAYIMVLSPVAGGVGSVILAILAMIVIGGIIGAINGFAVVKLKMPSFVATLATMMIGEGIAVWFANMVFPKTSQGGLPNGFNAIGGAREYFWIPVIIAVVVVVITNWLLKSTRFGKNIYAVGTNPNTAFISGVPVKKVIFILCLISGLLAGVSSVMYTAKNGAGIPTMGDKLFIDIIGGVIIGGTSMAGGSGGVKKTLYGVLFLVLIDNILSLMGVCWYLIDVIKGSLILLAAILDIFTKRVGALKTNKLSKPRINPGSVK